MFKYGSASINTPTVTHKPRPRSLTNPAHGAAITKDQSYSLEAFDAYIRFIFVKKITIIIIIMKQNDIKKSRESAVLLHCSAIQYTWLVIGSVEIPTSSYIYLFFLIHR